MLLTHCRVAMTCARAAQYSPTRNNKDLVCVFSLPRTSGVAHHCSRLSEWCLRTLQGYIHRPESPFHVPYLHDFSEPGHVFDPNGSAVLSLVPVIMHATVIFVINQFVYRRVAGVLTAWENHRTEKDFQNALIVKRYALIHAYGLILLMCKIPCVLPGPFLPAA